MTSSVAISKSFNEIKRRKKESNSISISSSDLPPVPSFLLSSSNYSNLYYEDNFSDDDEVIIIEDDGIELEDVYVEIEEQYVSSPPSNKSEAFHSNENLTPNHRNNSKNKRENSPSYSPKLSFVRNDKLEHILGKRKELSLGDKIPIELILSAFNKPNSTQFISSTDNDNNFGNLRNFNNSYIENNLKSCDFSSRNNFDVLGEEDKKSIEIAQPTLLIKDEPEFNETVEIITEEIVQHPQLPIWLHEPLRFPNLSEEEKRNLMSSVSEFPSFPIVEIPTRKNHKMNGGRGGRRYPNYPQKHLSFYKFNALESFHEFPKSACDLLEDELTSFYNWISPTPFEMENRMNTIHDITSVITNLFPNVEVAVYGSVATELCLPTSDIDMVIMNGGNWSLNLLFTQLKSELIEREICSENEIKIIYSAMVPIIKLVHKCGIPVDISFGNRSFLNNLSVVKNYLQKYDYAKPIIFFLKQLLHQQNLNITYSGGLGSYSLVIIVIHFIQINDKITNIGELLLRFLQCYGYSFDYSKFGISCYHQGSYFLKEEKNWFSTWSPNLLAVEDPLDEENDLGRKAFNIQEVRSLFADVYKKIVDTIITGSEGPSSSSIIGQIINNVSRI